MKKNKGNPSKIKVQAYSEQELMHDFREKLLEWKQKIKEEIKYQELKQKKTLWQQGDKNFLKIYLNSFSEYMNVDRFAANIEDHNNPQHSKNGSSLKKILLDSQLFQNNRENRFLVSIDQDCAKKIDDSIQEDIILRLLIYGSGFLPLENSEMEISLKEFNRSQYGELRYYTSNLGENWLLVFSIGYEKIPVWSHKVKEIEEFQINLCITLEGIIDMGKIGYDNQLLKKIFIFLEKKKEWDVRYIYSADDLKINEAKTKGNNLGITFKNPKIEDEHIQKVQRVKPTYFKNIKCCQIDTLEYLFKYQEQKFYEECIKKQPKKVQHFDSDVSYEKIMFSHAKEYVNFLSEIPNFKFKLTNQQKDVVGENGNLIVIGRSGTGKTLLSILRLYSMDFLRKQASIEERQEREKTNKKCLYLELQKTFEEKNVFLTASSHLIEEIMKQYKDMHFQILSEHKKHCQNCQKELNLEIALKIDDLQELLNRIEARESINSPISLLSKEHFPQFFTVKTMLNIIDSGLKRPFFNVEATKKIEEKNVKGINIYWQNVYRLYEPFEDQLDINFKNRMEKYTQAEIEKKKSEDAWIQMIEVDYKYFAREIWPKISKKYFSSIKKDKHRLNSSVVWAEIYSIIKGSVKAHTTHLKCLSPKMYIEQSKSPFLSIEQKMEIYSLFEEYQKYKIYNREYDLMDVVNHILQQILFNRYQDEKLDNMFIDEVQDLTPATIYLLTKMTKKNNFYCGDTAQAISKGVSFKFSQIKSLYSKKYFKHYIHKEIENEEKHLTVNFRSHNRILMLANAVVSMMKELFPKTIDVLKEERSDLIGPHNYLIENGDERLIYDLLLGPQKEQEGQNNEIENLEENKNNEHVVEKTEKIALVDEDRKKEQRNMKKVKIVEEKIEKKIEIPEKKVEKKEKYLYYDEQFQNNSEQQQQDKYENGQQEDENQEEDSEEQQSQEQEINEQQKVEDLNDFQLKEQQLMDRKFQSEQVVLVRNEEQKKKLPNFISKEHKLTCEEVKGLEYDDVVIYNFFSSSPCLDKWVLLDYLDIKEKFIDVKVFESELSRRTVEEGGKVENVELEEETRIQLGFDVEKKMYRVFEIKTNNNYLKIDIKDFHEISSELKLFYTLLTRAKNTVIIFDQKVPRQLTRFFKKMNIVKTVKAKDIHREHDQIFSYRQRQSKDRYINKNRLWQEQAIRMLVRENYDEAIKGFERAGNIKNVKRVQAMKIQKETELELHQIKTQLKNPEKLPKEEFRLKKLKLIRQEKQIYEKLSMAGKIFKEINLFEKAGQNFMKTKKYQEASECFANIQNSEKIAECFFQLALEQERKLKKSGEQVSQKKKRFVQNLFDRALFEFKASGNLNGILDCYIHLKQWENAFELMRINKDIAKSKLRENQEFGKNIKFSLENMINNISDTEEVKNERHFNEGFLTQKQKNKDREKRQLVLSGNKKLVRQKMEEIYQKYSEFELQQIKVELTARKKEWDEICKKQKTMSDQKQTLQKASKLLVEGEVKSKAKVKVLSKSIQQMGLSVADIEQLNKSKDSIDIIKQFFDERDNLELIKKQINELTNNLCSLDSQLEILVENKEMLKRKINPQELQYKLKVVEIVRKKISLSMSQVLPINISTKINNKVSQNLSSPFFFEDQSDLVSNSSSSRQTGNYRSYMNTVFKVRLSEDTISSILNETQAIIDISEELLMTRPLIRVSELHHKYWRFNLQFLESEEIKKVLKMLKILSSLNCMPTCFMLCDYYSLKFHVPEMLLKDMLSYSRNFFEKRKIKEVTNIIVDDEENREILAKGSELLGCLGEQTLETFKIKKATNEVSFKESIVQDIVVGLILQGFYESSTAFYSEAQRFINYYMFLDYDSMLKQSLIIEKERYRLKMKSQYKYYFFEVQIGASHQQRYRNLLNIFSIQKIFFDHDQCLLNPFLSKAIEIDEIELNDDEINECRVEVDEEMRKNHADIDNQKIILKYAKIERDGEQKRYWEDIWYLNQDIKIMKKEIKNICEEQGKIKQQINLNYRQWYKIRDVPILNRQLSRRTIEKKNIEKYITYYESLLAQGQEINGLDFDVEYQLQTSRRQLEKVKVQEKQLDEELKLSKKFDQKVTFYTDKSKNLEFKKKNIYSQINLFETKKKNIAFAFQKKQKEYDKQEQDIKKFIETWESKVNIDQEQSKIMKAVIAKKKKQKVNSLNRSKRQQIQKNIQKASNLEKQQQFNLLSAMIKDEVSEKHIKRKGTTRQTLMNTFNLLNSQEIGKLKNTQICMIITTALSFLFNDEFRDTCIKMCQEFQNEYGQQSEKVKQYQYAKMALSRQIEGNMRKIENLQTKLNDPGLNKNKKSFYREEMEHFQNKIRQNQFNILQWDNYAERSGLLNLNKNSWIHISNLLSVFSLLQNISDENFNFIEILFGFFQCRVIRNCQILSFLGKQYVFVQSDSIILTKMIEENKLSFGYYFDCHNKIVLASFTDVHQAILKYLEKQQKEVLSKLVWNRNNIINKVQCLRTDVKAKYIEKQVVGVDISKESEVLYQAELEMASMKNKKDIQKLYQDFKDNKLLTKTKNLKREVLQFYLSNEHKEKESFFFALFQLKEYHNVEELLTKMTFFNPKLLNELTKKVTELEKEKENWIKKERFQEETMESRLKQQQ